MSSPSQSSKDLLRPNMDRDRSSSQQQQGRLSPAGIYGSPPVPNIPPLRAAAASPAPENSNDDESAQAGRRVSPRPSSSNLQVPEHSPMPEELTEEQQAEIVARHLVDKKGQRRASRSAGNNARPAPMSRGSSRNSQHNDDDATNTASDDGDNDEDDVERIRHMQMSTDEFPMPFGLQGGDVTHDVYKWHRDAVEKQKNLKRSKSTGALSSKAVSVAGGDESMLQPSGEASYFDAATAEASMIDHGDPTLDYKKIMVPGGFRRNFIARQQGAAGASGTSTPEIRNGAAGATARPGMPRATSSFVEFLSLYGHFGGEDLEEIEEEDEDDEEEALRRAERGIPHGTLADRHVDESTPLLKRQDTRARIARKRLSMKGERGDATVTQAVMMLLKSFVGTGILFLGRAFKNGGMLFSIVVLLSIAMISLYSFLLLVKTRLVVPGSFGDMGGVLYGSWMRIVILTAITLSQVGFVSAYTIFVAENLVAFVDAITNCRVHIPVALMIFAQIIFYLPLAMFRNIQKLSWTALVADAFILIGIVYIFSLETISISNNGLGPGIVLFNKESFPLLVGTAVFAFEGVGLVIPITEAMREPEKFPKVLTWVMIGVALLFGGAGALGYAAFGKDIQTVVLVNLPQEDRFVNVVQLLYSLAIMLSTPLQLFPAVRIMEQGIFSEKSGKYSNRVKWQKNVFRSLVVVGCTMISWAGARDLDKFVSLVGSVACVPLAFILPSALYLKAVARTKLQMASSILIIIFGLAMMCFTSVQTIQMLVSSSAAPPPDMGKCKPRA